MNRHGSLNRIYRLIWSHVTNSWVAVAENVKGRGKGKNQARKLVAAALVLSAVTWVLPQAYAGPSFSNVAKGSASVSQSGLKTTIDQATQYALLNWSGFNVAANETVTFNQPSASALAVNQISDLNGSPILGHINANGDIFLINPNGMVFGKGAVVNVGGLVASGLKLANTNGLSYAGSGLGSVTNQGSITAGKFAVLLGSSVTNEGSISARLCTIILGAGNSATLTLNNSSVRLKLDASTMQNLINNGGLIQADGGSIILSAGAKSDLISGVVNTGLIQARTVDSHNGTISLLADMQSGTVQLGGTLDASAPDGGNGGAIETSAASVKTLAHFSVDTSVGIGKTGKSGRWLIDLADFTIAASGGDLSGADLNTALASTDVTISTNAAVPCVNVTCNNTNGTNGDINVNDSVTWSTHALTLNAWNNINVNQSITLTGAGTLNLVYGQDALNAGNQSALNLSAPINLAGNSSFNTKQGSNGTLIPYTVITNLGLPGSATGADLQGINGNLSGNYVLGSNIDATITTTWNVSAGVDAGFLPIGNLGNPYTGLFNGLGHFIANLSIYRPAALQVGLFGTTGSGSVIRNVGLINPAVQGNYGAGALIGFNYGGAVSSSYVSGGSVIDDSGVVGGLVGYMRHGSISNSYSSANVSGQGAIASEVGGLVGYNYGAGVSNSYALGNVSGQQRVGGLIGANTGSITNTYATGAVSGTDPTTIGGLIGYNSRPYVSNSYWNTSTNAPTVTGAGSASSATTGITGLTNAAMQNPASFANFNFTTTPGLPGNNWVMVAADGSIITAGSNGAAYPMLSSEYSTSISNAHQLQLIAMNLAGSYTVVNDINVAASNTSAPVTDVWNTPAGFVPLGNSNTDFSGSFDGAGHTIDGLYINMPGASNVGLFGVINKLGAVSNVNLTGTSIVGGSNTGALAGTNNGTIGNSFATGNVVLSDNDANAAGLVGNNNGGTITGSGATGSVSGGAVAKALGGLAGYNSGAISLSNAAVAVSDSNIDNSTDYFGGLVGQSNGGSIRNSHSTGNVLGDSRVAYYVGGLIGWSTNTTIDSCSATGNVTGLTRVGCLVGASYGSAISSSQASTGTVSGITYVGGLIGQSAGSLITYSSAGGTVTGSSEIGGLIGVGNGGNTINNDHATGDVIGAGNYVGGLIGQTGLSSIGASDASGNVTGVTYVGGLVGLNNAAIDGSHASGKVQGSTYTGGLVGRNNAGSISNSYGTGSVQGNLYTGGLVGWLNAGNIVDSYATGIVTDTAGPNVGGLVGYVNSSASASTISNSHASGAVMSTDIYIGGLVGYFSTGTISNGSYASGSVSGNSFVGGLVGAANGGAILNSSASGNVSASGQIGARQRFGGLIGTNGGAAISNSFATGSVTATGTGDTDIGGLIGNNSGPLTCSYATGPVTGSSASTNVGGLVGVNYYAAINNSHASGQVLGGSYTGGLVGQNNPGATITGSIASGSVAGISQTGGLVGQNNGGTIIGSYATGAVTGASSSSNAGGLVGLLNNGSISTSYATGPVQGGTNAGGLVGETSGSAISDSYATGSVSGSQSDYGGLVGFNGPASTIKNSYSAGSVTGGSAAGGLIGGNLSPNSVTNSFWDMTSSGQTTSAGGIGMVTSDMKTQANFISATPANSPGFNSAQSWNFGSTWFMYPGATYPLLQTFMTPITVALVGAVTTTYNSVATNLAGTLTWFDGINNQTINQPGSHIFGSFNGPTNAGTYTLGSAIFVPGSIYSDQQGYLITYNPGSLVINPAALTVTGQVANNKVYDGSNAVTFMPNLGQVKLNTVFASDTANVVLNQSGYFDPSFAIGNGRTVTVNDTITGSAAGNYNLIEPTGLTANITSPTTPLTITGTTVVNTKFYDGTTVANVSGGKIASIAGVTLVQAGTYASSDANYLKGSNTTYCGFIPSISCVAIPVVITDYLTGPNAALYTLAAEPTNVTGNILPIPLLATGTAQNKVYDGTFKANMTNTGLKDLIANLGVLSSDHITAVESGVFVSRNVGTNIPVVISDSLTAGAGTNVNDYFVVPFSFSSANITQATLTYVANGVVDASTGMVTKIGGNVLGFVGGDTLSNAASGMPVWLTSACTVSTAGTCKLSHSGIFSITGSGVAPDGNYKSVIAQASNTALAPGVTGNNASALCVEPCLGPLNHTALQLQREFTATGDPAAAITTVLPSPYLLESDSAGHNDVKPKLPALQIKDGGVKLPAEWVAMN